MSSDVAPNSIACAAWAIIVPATEAIIHTPSTRSVLASAMTFTKPSGSRLVLARLLASIGNLPTLTSPCCLGLLLGQADAGDLGHGVDDASGSPSWFTIPVRPAIFSATAMPSSSALWASIGPGNDVADRPDARRPRCGSHGRSRPGPLGVDLEPRLVEAEPVGVRPPPDRDQHDIGFDRLRRAALGRLDGQRDACRP